MTKGDVYVKIPLTEVCVMKKFICLFITTLLLGGVFMSGCTGVQDTHKQLENLRIWAETGTEVTEGDLDAVFTQGAQAVTLSKDGDMPEELTFSDWYSAAHTEQTPFEGVGIYMDLGFSAAVDYIDFSGIGNTEYKIYASDDGYNFTRYLGVFSGERALVVDTFKAVNVVFKADTVVIGSVSVCGTPAAEKKLLSLGAPYVWEGLGMSAYSDKEGAKLTDGKYFSADGESAVAAKTSHEQDERTGRTGNIITIDLGKVQHVSEVSLGAYTTGEIDAALSDRISVRYSADGEVYEDFGQSFLLSSSGKKGDCSNRYTVTRPSTVEARYIKVLTYVDGIFATDEIEVWGAASAVAEPEYTVLARPSGNTNTIVSAGDGALTDGIFDTGIETESAEIQTNGVTNAINIVSTAKITDLSVEGDIYYGCAAGIHTALVTLDTPVTENTFTLSFKCEGTVNEIQTFGADIQKPLVDGGFFQLPTNGGNDVSTRNDAYSWYLSLKGMRDLGMSTVIIQYSTHYNAKTTLINGKNIIAAGYTYTPTYGVEDLCGTVLDAAEKLGMKVFIGTIHDADFTNPSANAEQYKAIVADGEAVIKDIYEMYSSHPAFGGYYLSDETCDYWLNFSGGVEAARTVYEGQSKVIRALDDDGIIMIAPAIWRSGTVKQAEENLYNLICPAADGEKPVVDIVAVQDCLGREQTLTVSDETYLSWLNYCQAWAKGIRAAGADFWHDAEVFEINYSSKRFSETEKSLTLQYSLSGGIVVFDIPHYMTPMALWGNGDWYGMYKMWTMKNYIEYYSEAK